MEDSIQIESVIKRFNNFQLGPIDLTFEQGTVLALVGENGSGKSTLLQIINQLLQKDEGNITIFGDKLEATNDQVKQNITYIGEELLLAYSHMTINKMTKFIERFYNNWDQMLYDHLISRYEINVNEKYTNCSTGTKKKVAFILAVSSKPKLLLLDEPSANVDMLSQYMMMEDLRSLQDSNNSTIIIATHMEEDLKKLADYICILKQGKIVAFSDKDTLQESWARVWLDDGINLSNIQTYYEMESRSPLQLITNDIFQLERELLDQHVKINQIIRLELREVITKYCQKSL
ncbi:ATP-binding cassette domain-containing protein [Gracilibacillus marinus]|uniref:ATP-binding cassette domain-containing protein n=1 Tax=Gracilibacillus marinus TaxID=630535 RepID=A0ABV8VV97_9BACI